MSLLPLRLSLSVRLWVFLYLFLFLANPRSAQAQPPLGQTLLQDILACSQKELATQATLSLEVIQTTSMTCTFQVVILHPDGRIRADANDRMVALVESAGLSLPHPVAQGQAQVGLEVLMDTGVFTLPVQLAGQTYPFLLDTGASSSILSQTIAAQLGLQGTPIPDQLFSYMVVGEQCEGVGATIYSLPGLGVQAAKIQSLLGLGLPDQAVPGELAGVLGMDVLSNFDVVLDPQGRALQLSARSQALPNPSLIPLQGQMGVMTAQVKINDRGPFTLALDTGAGWMVLSPELGQQIGVQPEQMKDVEVLGFCGRAKGKQLVLDRVGLGNHEVQSLNAVILDNSAPLQLLGVDGIVGQNFLSQFRQHWRFGERNALGFPENGSLELRELE